MDAEVASTSLKGFGTLLSAFSSFKEGMAVNKANKAAAKSSVAASKYQAAQLEQQAGQERATSQRQAIEERRKARMAIGRAKLIAAASGAGASDVDIQNITANLAAEGEYNALARMYTGEETARGLEMGAQAALYEGKTSAAGYKNYGKAYKNAAIGEGIGTLLSGGASFLEKYGDSPQDSYVQTYTPAYKQPGFVPPGIH